MIETALVILHAEHRRAVATFLGVFLEMIHLFLRSGCILCGLSSTCAPLSGSDSLASPRVATMSSQHVCATWGGWTNKYQYTQITRRREDKGWWYKILSNMGRSTDRTGVLLRDNATQSGGNCKCVPHRESRVVGTRIRALARKGRLVQFPSGEGLSFPKPPSIALYCHFVW